MTNGTVPAILESFELLVDVCINDQDNKDKWTRSCQYYSNAFVILRKRKINYTAE